MKSLDILISTFGHRIHNVHKVLLPPQQGVRYLIGHQSYNGIDSDVRLRRPDVLLFRLESIGVAKSRNELLVHSLGDILYFCDDDVILNNNIYRILESSHTRYSDPVLTFKVMDEDGGDRKIFPADTQLRTRRNILSVGTVEISLKNDFKQLEFPENMGAGTSLPLGDEAVYLSRILDAGGSVRFIPQYVCTHPLDSSGYVVSKATCRSRGVVLNKVFGLFAYIIWPGFLCKNFNLFKGQTVKRTFHNLRSFLNGIFIG